MDIGVNTIKSSLHCIQWTCGCFHWIWHIPHQSETSWMLSQELTLSPLLLWVSCKYTLNNQSKQAFAEVNLDSKLPLSAIECWNPSFNVRESIRLHIHVVWPCPINVQANPDGTYYWNPYVRYPMLLDIVVRGVMVSTVWWHLIPCSVFHVIQLPTMGNLIRKLTILSQWRTMISWDGLEGFMAHRTAYLLWDCTSEFLHVLGHNKTGPSNEGWTQLS